MKRTLQSERGIATIIALILVGMLTLLGIAALTTSDDEVSIAGNDLQEMRAFYAAEGGLERGAASLQAEYDSTNAPPLIMPSGGDTVNLCTVEWETTDLGPATMRDLTTGTLAGLHALIKSFAITSTATNTIERARITLNENFETALVPLFQFAVFYGNDLEIAPGADMTLFGRVHSNGGLWLQTSATLKMDSYVTASGHIKHGRKGPGSVDGGDVQIKDATGAYVSMKEGGSGWLESTDNHWYDSSVSRWDGRVRDSAHGQGELNLPLSSNASGDAHALIARDSGGTNPDSYSNQASLKIVDGKIYKKVGSTWSDVTTDFTSKGIITVTNNKFKDQREGKWVDVTDLDVSKLYSQGYGPSNGILYFSDKQSGKDFPAIRLKNATTLGAGLTIASENPMYTLGDYNTVNKKPAALMADAVTFLSSSFNDAKSDSAKSKRVPVATTVNASYLSGNVATTSTNYSGGFENLPRFLEDWAGKAFTWNGSAVCLWNSRQAIGKWANVDYYSAPKRVWSYDTDLNNPNKLPPGTPMIRVFQRTGWQQEDVGYTMTE